MNTKVEKPIIKVNSVKEMLWSCGYPNSKLRTYGTTPAKAYSRWLALPTQYKRVYR